MRDAIEQCGGHFGIAEHGDPFREGQPVCISISISLAHPIGDGVQGCLELLRQAAKRTSSTVELHQLTTKFWRVGRPVSASHETPPVVVSGCPQQRGNSTMTQVGLPSEATHGILISGERAGVAQG